MTKKNILTQSRKKKAQALMQGGRLAEARALYEQICALDQRDAEAWFFLGAVNGQLKNFAKASECFRRVAALRPDHALAYYNLGMALRSLGKFEEAVQALREAVRLEPRRTEIQVGLAHTYVDMNKPDGAEICYRELVKLCPDDADMHFNLGMMRHIQHHLEGAVLSYRKALELRPDFASVHDNLGNVYCEQGKYEEALACHRQALHLNPGDDKARSNILMTMLYMPDQDPGVAFAAYRQWEQVHGKALAEVPAHPNRRDPERRLRIGYVSPDFRTHSVAYFFEPLLADHDRQAVETVCYSTATQTDATMRRLQGLAGQWRDISHDGLEQTVNLIRGDQIDILVDLAGHTAGNRLKVFAHKPAPVQVTYLGYPNTTGLSAMDYRLTDAWSDPEGEEAFYAERLVRLPDGFLCYRPPADSPEVAPPPALAEGHVTFGSFNNLAKVNPGVVALWSQLLTKVGDARLIIKTASLDDPATCERYYRMFEERGIARGRIDLLGHVPALTGHLGQYARLDIALDTFPYNGTTTTCEALWMGVPVVTLAGRQHAGRVGVSLLNNAGVAEWIAASPEQYIALAVQLAADIQGLVTVRANLRQRLAGSRLCDGKLFARTVEAAYREMWRSWCASVS